MKAQQFLDAMASTANALDFDAHMNLISKQVKVYGVPGFEVIGYQDWHKQCQDEFSNKVLKRVSYQGMELITETPDNITFKSTETVEGTDGTTNTNTIEFIIQKEADGQWRVSQERILAKAEPEYDILRGLLKS